MYNNGLIKGGPAALMILGVGPSTPPKVDGFNSVIRTVWSSSVISYSPNVGDLGLCVSYLISSAGIRFARLELILANKSLRLLAKSLGFV